MEGQVRNTHATWLSTTPQRSLHQQRGRGGVVIRGRHVRETEMETEPDGE